MGLIAYRRGPKLHFAVLVCCRRDCDTDIHWLTTSHCAPSRWLLIILGGDYSNRKGVWVGTRQVGGTQRWSMAHNIALCHWSGAQCKFHKQGHIEVQEMSMDKGYRQVQYFIYRMGWHFYCIGVTWLSVSHNYVVFSCDVMLCRSMWPDMQMV